MLLLNKPTERCREDKVTIESACPSTLEQPISQDNPDEFIDLTEDSEMTAIHQPQMVQYNTSNNELQFSIHLFVNITAELMNNLSHDIDGLKLCKIKCLP